MKIYAVIGTAPKHMGQPCIDAGQADCLVSFADYAKAFKNGLVPLTLEIQQSRIKRHERKTNPEP
jgi:hypothetical protein